MVEPDGSGRRERKQVEFYSDPGKSKGGDEVVVKKGKGEELGEIPNVNFHLGKVKGTDEVLEDLHMVLFRRKGKGSTRKRDIKKFSGFVYPEGSEELEKNKDLQKIANLKLERIHQIMDIMDMPRGLGDKETKVKKLWEFLEKPEALSNVDKAEKEAQKKAKRAKKRVANAGKRARKSAAADDEDEDEDEEEEDGDEDESPPKKKKAVKRTPRAEKAVKRTPKASKAEKAEKRKAGSGSAKPRKKAKKEAEEEDEELDVPLAAVGKVPADDVLEKDTLEILKTVDVQQFSINGLLQQLEKKYGIPEGTITKQKQKKELIKRTAIRYCDSQEAAAGEDGKEGEGEEEEGEEEEGKGEEAEAANGQEEGPAAPAEADAPKEDAAEDGEPADEEEEEDS